MQFLQNSTSLSRIDRTRNTKLREGTKSTVAGTLADFGYERTPGWAGRVQKRVLRILGRRELGRTRNGVFGGVGVGLGRLGFAGGPGLIGAASGAILGPIGRDRFLVRDPPLEDALLFFVVRALFWPEWGGQNPDGRCRRPSSVLVLDWPI